MSEQSRSISVRCSLDATGQPEIRPSRPHMFVDFAETAYNGSEDHPVCDNRSRQTCAWLDLSQSVPRMLEDDGGWLPVGGADRH
jgi:hypothetical protein